MHGTHTTRQLTLLDGPSPLTHQTAFICAGITISKRLALEEFHSKNLTLGVVSEDGWTEEAVAAAAAVDVPSSPPTGEQPSNPIR